MQEVSVPFCNFDKELARHYPFVFAQSHQAEAFTPVLCYEFTSRPNTLSMYGWMYVWMYVCMYVCTYINIYLYIYAFYAFYAWWIHFPQSGALTCMYKTYICVYSCMYTNIYMYIFIHTYVCMDVCMYVCTYINVCLYMYVYI
jgi:hypothetical protein